MRGSDQKQDHDVLHHVQRRRDQSRQAAGKLGRAQQISATIIRPYGLSSTTDHSLSRYPISASVPKYR